MVVFRIITLVLAVLQVLFTAFTGMVGAFADGGDVWSRLLLIVVHPLCAVALLALVLFPKPTALMVYAVGALLVCNIVADVTLALLIATEAVKGDWFLPLAFAVIPLVGIVYALTVAPNRDLGSSTQTGA